MLETQRNNAQNDLVRVASEQDRQEKYWRSYLVGLEQQRQALEGQHQAMNQWWQAYLAGLEQQRQDMNQWWQAYQQGLEEQRQTAAREGAAMTARAAEAARRR